jgi:hypothetical protein
MSYGVEVVGSDLDYVMDQDPERFLTYLNKLLRAMAIETYNRTSDRLAEVDFKNSTGRIHQALGWHSGDGWAAVSMDDTIAPHAVHVERGVRPHTMRYLLKAKGPLPIKVGKALIFRKATEKWMDRPHRLVDPVSGLVHMSKGWRHPGYEGKHFMLNGLRDAVDTFDDRVEHLVFRIFTEGDLAEEIL